MVEIWLPYENTELPIMLPDPIDLRIQPRKLFPERRETDSLKKLYTLVNELDEVKLLASPFYTEVERHFIDSLLNRLEITYSFVSEDPNVIIDIPRYDPVLGFKCSISTYLMSLNKDEVFSIVSEEVLEESFSTKYFSELSENILYIDLMLSGGTSIYEIYSSRGGSHWDDLVKKYREYWSLKNDFADVVISSVGGGPWDNDLSFIVFSLIKTISYIPDSSIGIVIGDGVISDTDLEKIISIKEKHYPKDIKDIYLLNLQHVLNRYDNKRIYYFGSLPDIFLKSIDIKNLKSIERFIRTIPTKMKRAITVIEDTIHLYPFYLGESR